VNGGKGLQSFPPERQPVAFVQGGARRTEDQPFVEQKANPRRRKSRSAMGTPPRFNGISVVKGQTGPKKERQKPGKMLAFLQQLQGLAHEKVAAERSIGLNAECLQKSDAIGGQTKTGPVPAQSGDAFDQHPFLQGQIGIARRTADPDGNFIENVKTADEAPPAAAASERESGKQAAGRRKETNPKIGFFEFAHLQDKHFLGKFHLRRASHQAVPSRDDFLFSGKEDELFMQGVYSYGTRPE
jgi:hypothetical protein